MTASTLHSEHFFRGEYRLSFLESAIHRLARQHKILVEAWAVFSNHYHLIAHVESEKKALSNFLSHLHTETATEINREDNDAGRKVWFNFWDTQLTFEKSYLARLNYVHHNPVKNGLVKKASEYRWCSAAWFERTATPAQVKTIYSFKIDRVKVEDDFEPVL